MHVNNAYPQGKNRIQMRLMIIATLIIAIYAAILSIAPAIKYHAGSDRFIYSHWTGVFVWIAAFTFLHFQSSRLISHRDPFLLPTTALLSGLGLLTIWRLYPQLGQRQTIWLLLASILVFVGIKFPGFLAYLRRYKYLWLTLGLVLTVLTIFWGTNPAGIGPKLWLRIFNLHLQPSEPLKLLLIIFLAGFFTDRLTAVYGKFKTLLPTFILTGIALLLLLFQRDLGTASIFLLLYLMMLYVSRGKPWMIGLVPLLVILTGFVGYFFIDIVHVRIDTWLNPLSDPSGASYQIIQSLIGIAEGGVIGTGVGLGSPWLIPVSVSDFIFSAVAEELGFFGSSSIILLVIFLLYRGIKIAINTHNSFHRYLSLGIVFYFGIQSIMIIGGNIGLLPLTGVTLPFVSYGGSSLIVSFAAMIILLLISDEANIQEDAPQITQPRFVIMGNLLMIVLIIEIIITSLYSFWVRPSLLIRPENPRIALADQFTPRGKILDRENRIIITNKGEIGIYQRVSNHIPLYPILGYTNAMYGQTGIEASMSSYLRGYEGYPYSELLRYDLLYNQRPEGLDIRLTLDLQLQEKMDDLLADYLGAGIIMNADSGEILAMASHPFFDAANLEINWEALISDETAPLVNRATQGNYPPGTALSPFLMAYDYEFFRNNPDPNSLISGSVTDLNCAINPGQEINWQVLVANGCKFIQSQFSEGLENDALIVFYQELGFFSAPQLQLIVAEPPTAEAFSDDNDLLEGEGAFSITPLQMALAVSTLTNNGVLPGPRIVNAYQNPEGEWITLPKLAENTQALPIATLNQVIDLISDSNSYYWQGTSTTRDEDGQKVSWFIAGTTPAWQGQPISIVVVLEDQPAIFAEHIGHSLIEFLLVGESSHGDG